MNQETKNWGEVMKIFNSKTTPILLLTTLGFLSGCGGSGGDDSDGDNRAALLVEPAISLQTIMNQGGYNTIEGTSGHWMELFSANLAVNNPGRLIMNDYSYDFDDSEWVDEEHGGVWRALVANDGQWQESELSIGEAQIEFQDGAGVLNFFGAELVVVPTELTDLSNQPIGDFIVDTLFDLVSDDARFTDGAQAFAFSNYYRGTTIVVTYSRICSSSVDEPFQDVEVVSANVTASATQCETRLNEPFTTSPNTFDSLSEFQEAFPYGGEFYFEAEIGLIAQFAESGELALFDWNDGELAERGQYRTITEEGIEFLEVTVPAAIDPYPLETILLAVYEGRVIQGDRYEENIVEGPEDDKYRFNFNDQAMREILQDFPSVPAL